MGFVWKIKWRITIDTYVFNVNFWMFWLYKTLSVVDCTMPNIGRRNISSICNLRATMGRLTKQCELVILISTKLFLNRHLCSVCFFFLRLLRIVHPKANRVIPQNTVATFLRWSRTNEPQRHDRRRSDWWGEFWSKWTFCAWSVDAREAGEKMGKDWGKSWTLVVFPSPQWLVATGGTLDLIFGWYLGIFCVEFACSPLCQWSFTLCVPEGLPGMQNWADV